ELFYYFGASLILGGAPYLKTFSPAQLNTLVLLLLKLYGTGGEIFMGFYGVAALLRGYLIFQSGYLPKFMGVFFTLGRLGFVTTNFALVVVPSSEYDRHFFR